MQPSESATRHAVIIPSTRRAAVLSETIASILRQETLPDQIIAVVVDDSDVESRLPRQPPVEVIKGRRGGASQRNDGLAQLRPEIEYVTFLDDDVELASDYLTRARAFLASHPEVAVLNGALMRDGNVTRAQAVALMAETSRQPPSEEFSDRQGAYANNVTLRRAVVDTVRFDERFRLYSWLEDFDFGVRCAAHGRCVAYQGCRAVHLAVQSGRVSGKRMGFSQIMNPYYIKSKGLMGRGQLLRQFWLPALASNLVKGLLIDRRVDRWGRLRGNLTALWLLARGRCEPEYVEHIR